MEPVRGSGWSGDICFGVGVTMKFVVVSDVRYGNAVFEVFERLGLDGDCGVVEKHVAVGADAKQIVAGVAAVMWTPERPDVMRLAVITAANQELRAAQLASVVVEKLELAADGSVANDAGDTLKNPVRAGWRVDVVGSLRIAPDVTLNLADAATAPNVLVDSEERAVTKCSFGRK